MADIIIDGTTGANKFLLLDSTGKIPAVDGSLLTTIAAGNIATGTIPVARIDTGSTANKIVVLDGSGRLPAVSAALVTNVSGATKNASDPTISTNPSGGVGTEWQNTTSGEVYICTDATAGSNVWTNVGAGSGNIALFHMHNSTNYGYIAGGGHPAVDTINKWSFASATANATDVGNLVADGAKYSNAGHSSETHGYSSAGKGSPTNTAGIDKFSFSADGNATDVGDVTVARRYPGGTSSSTHGFTAGGYVSGPSDIIDKFAFANESTTNDVGNLTATRSSILTVMSETYGYQVSHDSGNQICKWAYASDGNAVAYSGVTSAYVNGCLGSGTYSSTHGYVTVSTNSRRDVEKLSYASEGNTTNVGDLTVARGEGWGQATSSTYGYQAGGHSGINVIERYPFATDSDGVDVGDLTAGTFGFGSAGAHY